MNSSIFNFERMIQAALAPARIKAWAGFLCALMLACALAGSWALNSVMGAPPQPPRVAPRGTQALLLGNSQYHGMRTGYFSLPCFRATMPGGDYVMMEVVLHAQFRAAPSIRYLLLGFDNIPLRVTGIQDRKGDFSDLLDLGVYWYEIPEISPAARFEYGVSYYPLLRPLFVGPRPDVLTLTRQFGQAAPPAPPPPPGPASTAPFDPNKAIPPFTSPPSAGAKKMNYYLQHLEKRNNLENNRSAFLRMVRFCREHEIALFLLRGPTTREFRETRSEAWDRELAALYEDACAAWGGEIPLWNDDQNDDFPIFLFDDPNHLNAEGNVRYSQVLAGRLQAFATQNPAQTGAPGPLP